MDATGGHPFAALSLSLACFLRARAHILNNYK